MFLPFSLIVLKSIVMIILKCSVICYWLETVRWNYCMFVCFKPILNPNAWFYDYQNISLVCLIMLFFFAIYQWYWIRIVVSINRPFISKIIMLIITNDPAIIYWTFTNDDGCNLPIIAKWWFELGLFNNDSKLIASNSQEDWIW